MSKAIIYCAQHVESNKRYIGRTKKNLNYRKKRHLYSALKGSSFHFHNALRKYGNEAFKWTILEEELTVNESKIREKYWISIFKSNDRQYGYNSTEGGEDGQLNQESIKKMSNSLKENLKNKSNEEKEKISQYFSEFAKKVWSNKTDEEKKEIIRKRSEAMSGENHFLYNKKRSLETKRKLSIAISGNKNPNFRKKRSDDFKKKMSSKIWCHNPFSGYNKRLDVVPDGWKTGRARPSCDCQHCLTIYVLT